jgi:hypothetical protein
LLAASKETPTCLCLRRFDGFACDALGTFVIASHGENLRVQASF